MGNDNDGTVIRQVLEVWDHIEGKWATLLTWSDQGDLDYNRQQAIYWAKDYKRRMPTFNFRVRTETIVTISTITTNL